MKAKIVYISGGDNLIMSEINSVFSEIRKKMQWGNDVAMFAVPVSGEDLIEKNIDVSDISNVNGFGVVDNTEYLKGNDNNSSVLSVLGKTDSVVDNKEFVDPICNDSGSSISYEEDGPKVSCINDEVKTEEIVENDDLGDFSDNDSEVVVDEVILNDVSEEETKESDDLLEEMNIMDVLDDEENIISDRDEQHLEEEKLVDDILESQDNIVVDIIDDTDSEQIENEEIVKDELSDDSDKISFSDIMEDETDAEDNYSGNKISELLSGIKPMKQDEIEVDELDDPGLQRLADEFVKSDTLNQNVETKAGGLYKWTQMIFPKRDESLDNGKKSKKTNNNILSLFGNDEVEEKKSDEIPSFLRPKSA